MKKAKKSIEERLADIQKRKQQLAEQEKLIKARISQKERKERTRRLIQEGAILEKYLGVQSVEDTENVCKYLVSRPDIMAEISSILEEIE